MKIKDENISIMLRGGLGNQLFMYAVCIATSLKYNIPYCIPKHTMNDELWKTYNFENINYCNEETIHTATVYKETSFTYTKIPKPTSRYFVLDGYFQSYLYFIDYLLEIKKILGFDYYIDNNRLVSLHIRRGDYLQLPEHHPVITMDYISQAVDYFEELGYYKFFVFSDDINWCKENINTANFKWSDFTYSENRNEMQDLILLSSCQHNVIANSTFSYWGAMLNNNPNKIVVRPAIWFGEKLNHDISNLCPSEWLVL